MRNTLQNKPLQAVLTCASLAVIGACCACVLIPLAAASAVGGWLAAPFQWLQRGSHPDELYWVLKDGKEAAFRFGEACTFADRQGYRLNSDPAAGTPEPGQMDNFARDLPPGEVENLVMRSLSEVRLLAADGKLQLSTGLPVDSQLQADETVNFNYSQQASTSGSISTRSLTGAVKGNLFRGSYYGSQSVSDVVQGRGVEQLETIRADLSCPLILLVPVE